MKSMKTLLNTTIVVTALLTAQAAHSGDIQQNTLLNPSSSQLNAEANGRVMIYDQMDNETVEMALDTQFDRIDSMMFVRTQHVQEDGSIDEDDDC